MLFVLVGTLIICASLILIIFNLIGKLWLWKMHNDLIDWIQFGMADDIYKAKDNRKEYQHYVSICEKDLAKKQNIVNNVVLLIRSDLKKKFSFVFIKIWWIFLRK